jgi:hypothetical protein
VIGDPFFPAKIALIPFFRAHFFTTPPSTANPEDLLYSNRQTLHTQIGSAFFLSPQILILSLPNPNNQPPITQHLSPPPTILFQSLIP